MSVSDKKVVSAPVGLHEMANLLGEPLDVGHVCTSTHINIQAKFKPIGWGSPQIITPDIRYNLNHGFTPQYIKIPHPESALTIPTEMPVWGQWHVPDVRMGEWCRLSDFDGYNHIAKSFIREVKIETNHNDKKSIILNTNSSIVGDLYIKISINPDAEIKWEDFHANLGSNDFYQFRNYYLTVALVPTWFTEDAFGNTTALFWHSQKPVGDPDFMREFDSLDAIEFSFKTTGQSQLIPSGTTGNNFPENYPLLLVIGLTQPQRTPPLEWNQTYEFYSPVIFKEWSMYPWIKAYTSFKRWNGVVAVTYQYYTGGFYGNGYIGTSKVGATGGTYNLKVVGLSHYLQHCDSNGIPNPSNYSLIKCRLHFKISLKHITDPNYTVDIDRTMFPTANSVGFGFEYDLGNYAFEKEGNYEGDLYVSLDDYYETTSIIEGETASQTQWVYRSNDNPSEYKHDLTFKNVRININYIN